MGMFNKAINQIESSFLRGEKKYLYGAGAIAGTAAAGATYGLTDKDSGIKAGVAGAIGVGAGYFGAKYGINKSLDRMADLDIGFIMTGKSLGGIMNSKMGGKIDGDTFNKVAN